MLGVASGIAVCEGCFHFWVPSVQAKKVSCLICFYVLEKKNNGVKGSCAICDCCFDLLKVFFLGRVWIGKFVFH